VVNRMPVLSDAPAEAEGEAAQDAQVIRWRASA
jgi:hypothetical protein